MQFWLLFLESHHQKKMHTLDAFLRLCNHCWPHEMRHPGPGPLCFPMISEQMSPEAKRSGTHQATHFATKFCTPHTPGKAVAQNSHQALKGGEGWCVFELSKTKQSREHLKSRCQITYRAGDIFLCRISCGQQCSRFSLSARPGMLVYSGGRKCNQMLLRTGFFDGFCRPENASDADRTTDF